MSDDYTLAEMMVIATARAMPQEGVAMLGVGLPVLAGTLAKVLHAPRLIICTEVGAFDWEPPANLARAPVGIHDLSLNDGAAMTTDMVDALGTLLMGGNVTVGVLTGAQVDRLGNINTLVLGDYRHPDRRLAGTGGNTEIACLAPRVITMMPQEERRFPARVSFSTSPGYISGPGGRRKAGLAPQGPNLVVSTMGVFGFDTPDGGETGNCEAVLESVFANLVPEAVAANCAFEPHVSPSLAELPPPTQEELATLRRLDRHGHYLVPGRY